jgi:hypothetical protein
LGKSAGVTGGRVTLAISSAIKMVKSILHVKVQSFIGQSQGRELPAGLGQVGAVESAERVV